MRLKKEAEIERCWVEAAEWVGQMSARDHAMFCLGLYAGEGSKTPGPVCMANTNPGLLRILLCWLRHEFQIDEQRLRARVYLHDGLDIGGDRFLEPGPGNPAQPVSEAVPSGD